jgi:hypothetical protein
MEPAAYYNTNKIEGKALAEARQRNLSQEDKDFILFSDVPRQRLFTTRRAILCNAKRPANINTPGDHQFDNKRLPGKKHHGQTYHGALWNAGTHMET